MGIWRCPKEVIEGIKHGGRERFDFGPGLFPICLLGKLLSKEGVGSWLLLVHRGWIMGNATAIGKDGKDVGRGGNVETKGLIG